MFLILILLGLHFIAISFCHLQTKIMQCHAQLPQLQPTTDTTIDLAIKHQPNLIFHHPCLYNAVPPIAKLTTPLCHHSIHISLAKMESSSKRQREVDPNEIDIYNIAKEIQNQSGQPLGAPGVEYQRFCKNFGCCAAVALMLWQMLSVHNLVPPSGQIVHMLWTL